MVPKRGEKILLFKEIHNYITLSLSESKLKKVMSSAVDLQNVSIKLQHGCFE